MKHIEIVTHCYSGDQVPIYHRLLQMQLSSILEHYKKDIQITITVFYTMEDHLTSSIVHWFKSKCEPFQTRKSLCSNLTLNHITLPKKLLFRRAIGRNMAAKRTYADVVWFTDVDYLFFGDSIETAYDACLKAETDMVFANKVQIHRKHQYGDDLVSLLEGQHQIVHFNATFSTRFASRKERRAIGGIQIVKGNWCREHGYLSDTKWVNEVDSDIGFQSCKCDVAFRKNLGSSTGVEIPDLYRVRHSRCGRDHGTVDHGRKTA